MRPKIVVFWSKIRLNSDPEIARFCGSFLYRFCVFFLPFLLVLRFVCFLRNVRFVLYFTKDSAYPDFVGTCFFHVLPPNVAA